MALELETFFGKTTAGESHIMNANIIHVGTEKKYNLINNHKIVYWLNSRTGSIVIGPAIKYILYSILSALGRLF